MKCLVTGAAGFIGYHVSRRLLSDGHQVVGIDNLNDYYDVALKKARLARLTPLPGFQFLPMDIADAAGMRGLFDAAGFERVIHLAAQAGVRHSLRHPEAYVHSNVVGLLSVLEGCRHSSVPHLVFASSSSVYGLNAKVPFSEQDPTDHPVSLYAATKRAGELMVHTYSHLYGLPATGLRFFTVYGPWGRPDMAYFKFAESILEGRPIEIFGGREQQRDFTYIDDVVEAVIRLVGLIPESAAEGPPEARPDPSRSSAPFRIYNVGNRSPVALPDFVALLETEPRAHCHPAGGGPAAGGCARHVRGHVRARKGGGVPTEHDARRRAQAVCGLAARVPGSAGLRDVRRMGSA